MGIELLLPSKPLNVKGLVHVKLYFYVLCNGVLGISSEEQLRSFLAESLIMKDFKHPNILGLLGVCFNTPDQSPYIILPLMVNGSVKTYLRAKRVQPTNFDDCPVVSMNHRFGIKHVNVA